MGRLRDLHYPHLGNVVFSRALLGKDREGEHVDVRHPDDHRGINRIDHFPAFRGV